MSYLSDHLELSTPDKFMQLSMLSTNHSNYKSPNSKDTFQEADPFRMFELTKSQFDNHFTDLINTQDKTGFKKMVKRPIYQQKSKHNTKKTNNFESNV